MALSFGKIWGELLKPGWVMKIPSMIGTELWGYIGRKIRGDEQPSYTTNIQPVQTKKVQTYNSRYPWFDEEDYNRLLQIVDSTWKTWSEKAQLMDEAYQYYYPQVLNKHKLDERQETINNWVYENGEKLANWDKLTNAQYRLLNLTQMAKEKFDIAYNVEDTQIIHNIVEKTPNWQELLTKFLDTGDPELLYATWIYDKWQEAQDFRSQKDIANEVLWGNFWKNAWNTMYANSFAPLDSAEKFLYKWIKNMQMLGTKIDDYFADKDIPEWLRKDAFWDKTAEQIRAENQEFRDTSKREIDDYINLVNNANQSNRARTVNPIVDNYYNRRNFTDLLAEWDIDWFFYKWLWDAASNRDMPIIIWASIVNPAMWTALMWTNSYVRESEEAYETMRKAWATHEQAEAGGAVVWLVNSAIEVYLDKLLWGTETTTSKWVRDAIKKNVMKEVTNKPFEEIVSSATKTYVWSSLEEWLEEWLQNIVTNAAEMTVKENPEWKDLFEWGRAAAEWWIFNPFNILAPWGDIARNTDVNSIRQWVSEWINNIRETTRGITDKVGITKDWNTNTQWAVAVEWAEMVTPQWTETTVDETIDANNPLAVYQQWEITKLNKSIKDANNPMANMDEASTTEDWDVIELIDEEATTENNTNTDLAETQWGSKFWEAVSWLEDNIKEKIKRNPYAIEESRELIKNMENNPWLDFTEYQNERYESVLDMIEERLKQAEDKRRNDVWGLYTKLEEANAPIDTTNLKNRVAEYQARVEELWDILSSSDKAKIETILKNIQEIWDWTMDIWKVRKIADQWAKYDQWATWDWIRLIRDIRNAIDDEIMAQNPEMKEVDQAYKKAKDEIQDLRGNLTYKKTWEIKSNAVSTVKNMLNANNKKYLSTLEKYIPWITERLQAIRDSKLVYNAYTSWEGSRFVSKWRDFVTKWILAWGWWLLWWPVMWVLWYLVSWQVDKALTNLARKWLKETITKETAESRAELERINKKIEENQRLEAEEKAKLRDLWDRIMQKMATMDKTDAEQSAWESYLADLEQDEVIDMPEEVYDQWEEVTTTPKKKTTKKKTSKKS